MAFKKMLLIALSMIFGLIGLTIWLSVAQSTIPTAASSYYDLANSYNATVIGTGANTLATQTPGYLGYLWVVLPFAGAAVFIIAAFKVKKG